MGNTRGYSFLFVGFLFCLAFSQLHCKNTIVCIEGNSGAGKSTLAKELKKYFESSKSVGFDGVKPNVEVVEEPLEMWEQFGLGEQKWDIFNLFIKDSKNWNLLFNIFAFFTRLEVLKNAAKSVEDKIIILDRSPWSSNPYNMVGLKYKTLNDCDIQVFNYITSKGVLKIKNKNGVFTSSEDHHTTRVVRLLLEYVQHKKCCTRLVASLPDMYKDLLQYLCNQIHAFQKFTPDLFIFLNTPWRESFNRAENRDRGNKDPNSALGHFYEDLYHAHERWLKKGEWLSEKIEDIPVYIVDGMLNYKSNDGVSLNLCSIIHEMIPQESQGCESGVFEQASFPS